MKIIGFCGSPHQNGSTANVHFRRHGDDGSYASGGLECYTGIRREEEKGGLKMVRTNFKTGPKIGGSEIC